MAGCQKKETGTLVISNETSDVYIIRIDNELQGEIPGNHNVTISDLSPKKYTVEAQQSSGITGAPLIFKWSVNITEGNQSVISFP